MVGRGGDCGRALSSDVGHVLGDARAGGMKKKPGLRHRDGTPVTVRDLIDAYRLAMANGADAEKENKRLQTKMAAVLRQRFGWCEAK